MTPPSLAFPTLLQDFFQRRLVTERGVSAHTIASYRDTFELLLRYAEQRTRRTPGKARDGNASAAVRCGHHCHRNVARP